MNKNQNNNHAPRRDQRNNRMSVHYSRQTDEWSTPDWYFKSLRSEFPFTLDPCATHENHKCSVYFTKAENGLVHDWGTHCAFVNPPYSKVGAWLEKAFNSARSGATCVCLVPSRTDTRWWHSWAMRGEIRLLVGRLKFGDAKNSAPFPSALVVFRPPQFRLMTAKTITATI